jgi:gas vesicle protein
MSKFKNLKIMSFGLGINGALEGASKGVSIGNIIPGLGTTVGGIIGGGLGLLGGLFGGGSNRKDQEKLMEKAWEYEKEGMGMQYQYGQMAANEAQRRNLEMWESTNFEQQRKHMENADLSVGLMYGGGGQGAVSQGGQATQPSGPTSNPVGMALQYKQLEQQNEAIKSQTMLNQAEAAKALAEAKKTGGVDTKKTEYEIKWQEIENKIQESREQIASSNITEAKANAKKAMEEFKQAMLNTEYLDETQQQRIQTVTDQLSLIQKQGLKEEAIIDLTNAQASKVFLLLLCLLSIVVSRSNITANAHGFILSEIAAGIIIAKNESLCFRLFSTT